MKKKIIILTISLGIIGILFYSLSSGRKNPNQGEYEKEIKEFRESKDNDFRTTDWSPIRDKKSFKGLSYFSPNIDYKVIANLEYISSGETLSMKMTQGNNKTYLKYAIATFKINGQECRLLLLKESLQDPFAFVAFTDKTSGRQTYGGGRYLDVPLRGNPQTVTIDFNKTYNPFCAYAADFICPMPPSENRLQVEILAGEKNYK